MKITFWGVRGSIPVPGPETIRYGGNSSCVELRLSDDYLVVFDAGTGIYQLGKKLMKQKEPLKMHLLLSHGHMDHVHGFPFFGPAYMKNNVITLAGCPRGGKQVHDMLRRQMGDIYFPIDYDGLPAKIKYIDYCVGDDIKINSAKILTRDTNHPGQGIAFRVEEAGKSMVYMTDNELMAEGQGAYPFEHFVEFVQGTDLLIHDTQYTPEQYETRTRGWGHSTYEHSARLAVEGKVKKLVLFHHDPDHDDDRVDWMVEKTKESIKKLGGSGISCVAAREGASIKV